MRVLAGEFSPLLSISGSILTLSHFPCRFFAANEIKAMLAHVLLEYDVKPKDDSVGNGGGGMEWDFNFVPSREEVLLRKRVVEGELV